MKNLIKISAVLVLAVLFTISSCKKEEQGCTDSSAMNYQDSATDNDGTCEFAYDIALGLWDISSVCEDLTISIPLVGDYDIPLNDMFPDTIVITGEGENVVAMDINGSIILADVENDGQVTIQDDQAISFDTGVIGEVDVVITGAGTIESASNGDLTLNLAFDILGASQSSSCEITFSK